MLEICNQLNWRIINGDFIDFVISRKILYNNRCPLTMRHGRKIHLVPTPKDLGTGQEEEEEEWLKLYFLGT